MAKTHDLSKPPVSPHVSPVLALTVGLGVSADVLRLALTEKHFSFCLILYLISFTLLIYPVSVILPHHHFHSLISYMPENDFHKFPG